MKSDEVCARDLANLYIFFSGTTVCQIANILRIQSFDHIRRVLDEILAKMKIKMYQLVVSLRSSMFLIIWLGFKQPPAGLRGCYRMSRIPGRSSAITDIAPSTTTEYAGWIVANYQSRHFDSSESHRYRAIAWGHPGYLPIWVSGWY